LTIGRTSRRKKPRRNAFGPRAARRCARKRRALVNPRGALATMQKCFLTGSARELRASHRLCTSIRRALVGFKGRRAAG